MEGSLSLSACWLLGASGGWLAQALSCQAAELRADGLGPSASHGLGAWWVRLPLNMARVWREAWAHWLTMCSEPGGSVSPGGWGLGLEEGLSQLACWLFRAGGGQLAQSLSSQEARLSPSGPRASPSTFGTRVSQRWDLEGRMHEPLRFRLT